MFTVKANSGQNPSISYERNDIKTRECAYNIGTTLYRGFRDVVITDNETGEVCFSRYESNEFYEGSLSWGEAIELAEDEFYYEDHPEERTESPIKVYQEV